MLRLNNILRHGICNTGSETANRRPLAESAELARGTKSVIYGRMIQEDTGRPVLGATAALGDNSATFQLIQKEGSSQQTRHFERAIAAVKYAVMQLVLYPYLVATEFMVADVFTKAVDEETFNRCNDALRNTQHVAFMSRKVMRLREALRRATGAGECTQP